MNLKPMLCGCWDGVSVWLQWENAGTEYCVQVRYQNPRDKQWTEWRDIVLPQGKKSYWGVLPTWKQGWLIQARVGVDGESWELAREVTFNKSRCLFEVRSEKRVLRISEGDQIHAIVDRAACSYAAEQLIEIEAGESAQGWFTALTASGYCQLDRPGDFEIHPAPGVTIQNMLASVQDVTETGRDYSQITAASPKGPISIVQT